MKRGTLGWFRYRMISGVIFSVMGIIIATELARRPGAPQTKIIGFGFALAVVGLGVARIVAYIKARAALQSGTP